MKVAAGGVTKPGGNVLRVGGNLLEVDAGARRVRVEDVSDEGIAEATGNLEGTRTDQKFEKHDAERIDV